jgi:hypothetical protein
MANASHEYIQVSDLQKIQPTVIGLELGSFEYIKSQIEYDAEQWRKSGGEVVSNPDGSVLLNEADGTPKYQLYIKNI